MPVESHRSSGNYHADISAGAGALSLRFLDRVVSDVRGMPFSPETNARGDLAYSTSLMAGVKGDLSRCDVILNGEIVAGSRPVLDMAMSETALIWIEASPLGVVLCRYDFDASVISSENLPFHADRIVRDGGTFLTLGVNPATGDTMLATVDAQGTVRVQDRGQEALFLLGDSSGVRLARVTGDEPGLTLYAAADRFLRADTTDFAQIGNDEGRLAWHQSYRMLAAASLAAASGRDDVKAAAVSTAMDLLAAADENGNFPSSRYSLGDGQIAYSVHSGWLYHAAFAAYDWMSADQRIQLVDQAIRSFDYFESDWMPYGYRFTPGTDLNVDGVVQPWNQQATMGLLAIDLHRVTGDDRFLQRTEAIFNNLVAELVVQDGTAFWHYFPRIFSNGWTVGTFDSVNSPSRPPAPEAEFEDVYHVLLTLPFLLRAAEALGRPAAVDPDALFRSVHLGGLNFAAVLNGEVGGYPYLPPWPDVEAVWPFLVRDMPTVLPRYDSGVIDWLFAASAERRMTADASLRIEVLDPSTGSVEAVIDVEGPDAIFGFVADQRFDPDAVLPASIAFASDDADVHVGGDLDEAVRLMDGDDQASMGAGDDVVMGDHGDDRLDGRGGDDSLYGGFGDDMLLGDGGEDLLSGQYGQDILIGGAGADRLIGGGGIDTADYSGSSDRIAVDLNLGTGLGGDAHGDRLSGVENLIGTNAAATDWLTGSAGANVLSGLEGDDELRGLGGDDVLIGGSGADFLDGGSGTDTADYSSSSDRIAVDLSLGTGLGGDAHGDRLSGVENLVGTNAAAPDWLTGNNEANGLDGLAGDDVLRGLGGDDDLIGGSGADILDGGWGDDRLEGGAGDDFVYVDSAGDRVVELAGGGWDVIVSSLSRIMEDHVERMILTGSETLNGAGNDGDNRIDGNEAGNSLYGLDGNDSLAGNGGDDMLIGGAGIDYLYGGDGSDLLIGGNDFDYLEGGGGNDRIHAEGSDNVDAGDGDDVVCLDVSIRGAQVTLGGGQDSLILRAESGPSAQGISYLTDFDTASDGDWLNLRELLSGPGFSGLTAGADAFASGHLRLVQTGTDTLLQVDLDGGGDDFFTVLRLLEVQSDLLGDRMIISHDALPISPEHGRPQVALDPVPAFASPTEPMPHWEPPPELWG